MKSNTVKNYVPSQKSDNKVTVGVFRDDGDFEVFATLAQKDTMTNAQFEQWVKLTVINLVEVMKVTEGLYAVNEFVILERHDTPDVVNVDEGEQS